MSEQKTIHIFGVTGSIGQNTADIVRAHPDKFKVDVVSAHSNSKGLAKLAVDLGAVHAVIADEHHYQDLKNLLSGTDITIDAGEAALIEAGKRPADLSMMAIVGMAGLPSLWEALEYSHMIAIANKEPIVAAGALVLEKAKKNGTKILPVDSEHSAIFQCLEAHNHASVSKITLTASGGPFHDWFLEDIEKVTPEQALKHPNWNMGPKITIDSATMMNKALEIIEAHYLFNLQPEKIEVLIHPQSLIHSFVEYQDGSILCQMGASDMRTPIAYALSWPQRIQTPGDVLDLKTLSELTFKIPDHERFPALGLAYKALQQGQGECLALNAANEVAVDAFLKKKIGFLDIVKISGYFIDSKLVDKVETIDDILENDKRVRDSAVSMIEKMH